MKRKHRRKAALTGASSGPRYPRLRNLIELVHMMQASAAGISLQDIQERFSTSRRTAERMRDAVRDGFVDVEEVRLDDGSKRWRLREHVLLPSTGISVDDLAALATIGKVLQAEKHEDLLGSLRRASDVLRETMRWKELVRAEPDIEALSVAEGIASRPGPREMVRPQVLASLKEAIKKCSVVRLTHWTATSKRPSRGHEVEPLGLMYASGRRYLVGRSRHHGEVHLFRLGRVESVEIANEAFQPPAAFAIDGYARQSFGVFQESPANVVWRFNAKTASEARTFLFHESQKLEDQPDGSLLVSFKAGGFLEMCWHLFTWGDGVEVLKPPKLRRMYHSLLANAAAR